MPKYDSFKQFWKIRFWIILSVVILSNSHRLLDDHLLILIKLPVWLVFLWLLERLIDQYRDKPRIKKE